MGLVRADIGAAGIERLDRCDSNNGKDGVSANVQLLLNDGKALAFPLLAVVNNIIAFIASFDFFLGAFFSVLTVHSSLLLVLLHLCFKKLKIEKI